MKVGLLKQLLEQYDDNSLICIELTWGLCYKLNHNEIEPLSHNDDLFAIENMTRDPQTSGPILHLKGEF